MIDPIVLQNVLAYAAVFFAGFWVARRVYQAIKSAAYPTSSSEAKACAGCSNNCSSATAPRIKPLVQIGVKQPNIETETHQNPKC